MKTKRSKKKTKKTKKNCWQWHFENDQTTKKRRRQLPQNPEDKQKEKDKEEEDPNKIRFFGCYLLTSLSPRYKGHSYIGFTVNPKRRIRQHNGEITSGASTTKRKRPWEMVFCIHGFPTRNAALQFEWAWQHPMESVNVKEAAATFKTLGGLANKIKLALTMLTLNSWHNLNLTVSFFSTKYMNHTAGCPKLPYQMKLHFCSMDELPCYGDGDDLPYGDDHDLDDIDLHHNEEDAAELGEDGHLYGLVEMNNHFSTDNQSHTLQNARLEGIGMWPCDHRGGTHGLLEGESSSMISNATLEEQVQPLDQTGFAGNSMNEQVSLGKEMWTEGLRHSFPILEEHPEPFHGVDSSNGESSSFPILEEEHQRLFSQFPASFHRSAGNNMNEQLQVNKDTRTKQSRGLVHILEDNIQPFHHIDPFEGESSSVVGHLPITEKFAGKEAKRHTLIAESTTKDQGQLTGEQSPIGMAHSLQPSFKDGIEVIDLFTPSPDCRIIAGSKKRRVASDLDIIDLTRSPLQIINGKEF